MILRPIIPDLVEGDKGHLVTMPMLPLWVFASSVCILGWNAFSSLRGAILGGISWDEPNHVFMLQGWFATGYYAESGIATNETERIFVFGPVADLLGHLLSVALRFEVFGEPSLSHQSYVARHLTTTLISFLAIGAVVAMGRLLFNSWRWGILAGAILTSIPMWSGLAMFDHKDVATAAGLTLFSLGLVMLISGLKAESMLWLLVPASVMAGGLVLSVGTRISAVVSIILATLVGLFLAAIKVKLRHSWRFTTTAIARWLLSIVVAFMAAYAILAALYPLAFTRPMTSLSSSIRQSADFAIYPFTPPRTYVLEWFFIQTPLIISLLAIAGTIAGIVLLIWCVINRDVIRTPGIRQIGLSVVLVQAGAVPLFVIAANSILYHSIRHLLFIYPAVSILATVGVWSMMLFLNQKPCSSRTWLSRGLLGVVVLGIVMPTIDQTRLFPYGYAYFNPIARQIGIEGRWPTDYWRTSWRELYARIPNNDFAVCPDTILFPDDTMYDWPQIESFSCEYETKVNPFFTEPPNYDVSTNRFWFLRENAGWIYIPRNCELYSRVKRPLGLGEITLGYLAYCSYVPSPGPET